MFLSHWLSYSNCNKRKQIPPFVYTQVNANTWLGKKCTLKESGEIASGQINWKPLWASGDGVKECGLYKKGIELVFDFGLGGALKAAGSGGDDNIDAIDSKDDRVDDLINIYQLTVYKQPIEFK